MEDEFVELINKYFRDRDPSTPLGMDRLINSNELQVISENSKHDTLMKYFGSKNGSVSNPLQVENSDSKANANDSISVPFRSSIMEQERSFQPNFMQIRKASPPREAKDQRGVQSSSNGFFNKEGMVKPTVKPGTPSIRAPPVTRTFADIIDLEEMIPSSSNVEMKTRVKETEKPLSPSMQDIFPFIENERRIVRAARDTINNTVIPKRDILKPVDPKLQSKLPVKRVASKSKTTTFASQTAAMANWINEGANSKSQAEEKSSKNKLQGLSDLVNDAAKSMPGSTTHVKVTRKVSTANDNANVDINSEIREAKSSSGNNSSLSQSKVAGSPNQETGCIVIGNDLRVGSGSKSKPVLSKGRMQTKGRNITQTDISNFMNKVS